MSPAVRAEPCWLDPVLPCWRRPRTHTGLVAVVAPLSAARWADEVLAGGEAEALVWAATAQPERIGLHATIRPGVRAVSLTPAGPDLHQVRAAVQVAYRLAHPSGRATGGPGPTRARLTSIHPPATVDRSMRLPHLVTVRHATGTRLVSLEETVVWELVPRIAAPEWSRIRPNDQTFIEANLPGLLALRAAARHGRLPDSPAGQRLADALAGRPLTTAAVYRHLHLIRPLLTRQAANTEVWA